MPAFASKKQYRMMMAILHGKSGTTARGDSGPPKSVAEKYTGKEKGLPDDKGKAHRGGKWDEKAHKRHSDKGRKLSKSSNSKTTAVVVVNDKGQLLMGRQIDEEYRWSFPGGHLDEGESYEQGALRELKEETGLIIDADKLSILHESDDQKVYIARLSNTPGFHSTSELSDVGFYDLDAIDFNKLRACCVETMMHYLKGGLKKSKRSISDLMKIEQLEVLSKNIIRTGQVADAVYEFRHGDAIRLVGNGVFRMLKRGVDGMGDDDIRDIPFGSYTLHVRKHANDIYSGRIDDGLKTIHQFVNRSLPSLTGELMSVFEWYNDDEHELEIHEDSDLSDDTISDAVTKMVHNYRSYNIADIYDEMESIRSEIRHGNAVDLQQAEQRIMSLFDKLEERMDIFRDKHNSLAQRAGEEIDEIEEKLLALQAKIDEMSKKPSKMEAFSADPPNPSKIIEEYYEYLSRPRVLIKPNGHIIIDFGADWTSDDKTNFLTDMRAKALKDSR
jgi:ADP-ribose pyrophosphatase YjhB (NUDIX family)